MFLPVLIERAQAERQHESRARAEQEHTRRDTTGRALLSEAQEELRSGSISKARSPAERASREGTTEIRRKARELLLRINGADNPSYVVDMLAEWPQDRLEEFLSGSKVLLDEFSVLNDLMFGHARHNLDEALAKRVGRLEQQVANMKDELKRTRIEYQEVADRMEMMLQLPASRDNLGLIRSQVHEGRSLETRLHAKERELVELQEVLIRTNAIRLVRERES
jgi:hypothetical protein